MKMVKHKEWIAKIHRLKNIRESRYKKICLDKNERTSKFKKTFLKKIISTLDSTSIIKYPEVYNLYKALSRLHKLNTDHIVVTAGIDGAIKSSFELFVSKGDRVIVLKPTFAMLEIYCKIYRAKKISINYDEKLNLDINYLIKSINRSVSLIVIANPNSPTGTLISISNMERIIKKANKFRIPILVDEAYYGFSNVTVFPLLKKYNNLILSRTFSKDYGLAGLRVGYIISNTKLAKLYFNVKPMYEVNSIGVLISTLLLKNSIVRKKYISQTNKGLKLLIKYLKNNNISFIKTHANFIYIDLGKKINYFYKKLYKNGILAKKGMGIKGYDNYLRITLGPPGQMKKIISKLNKFKN
jgi:histidinol-phosphate aminotransferase